MAQSFTCPSCGAPLDYSGNGASTISCPYCYSSVIVPSELRNQRSEVSPDVTMSLAGQGPKLRELSNLIRAGQRDQAINVYSQVYHVDMANAQQLVDQLMQGSLSGSPMVITSDMGMFGKSVTTVNFGGPSVSVGQVPMAGGVPPTYTPTQPQVVYTTTAGQNNAGRNIMVWVGCFIAFFVFISIATTIIPIILAVIGAFVPFFF